jgi:putative ABC transport system permease protein
LPVRSVTTDYFTLLGLRMIEGRDIRATDDRQAPPVAVVNQAFAARYFGGGNPVGKKVWINGRQAPASDIVGLVQNGRTGNLTQAAEPEIYLSLWQASAFSKHLVIRTGSDPHAVIAAVQRELRSVDPTVSVENVKTLDEIRGDSLASRTFAMQLLVGFAVVGSVLTLVGIYGVLSLSVVSRRRELAIRAAVGADRAQIRRLVFREGFGLIGGGIAAGLAAAMLLARVLRTFLYGVEPADPLTLVGVGLLFTAVALAACWGPTRRAEKVDAIEALRYE